MKLRRTTLLISHVSWLISPSCSHSWKNPIHIILRGGHNGGVPPPGYNDAPPPGSGYEYDDMPPAPTGSGYEDYHNQQTPQNQNSLPTPPDLPSYDDPSNPNPNAVQSPNQYGPQQHQQLNQQPQQQQQQQQQQQLPPPPQPSLPDQGNYVDPPLPDQAYYEDPDDDLAMPNKETFPEKNDANLDLSQLDKDYILNGLAKLYRKKMLPLEVASKYSHFHSAPLSDSDFDAPPMVLLLGQYSVGKTSFIKYLLGRDFPGIRVGPEPTTDRFTAILHGSGDKLVPGAALCSQSDRPFKGLSPFGNNFLSRLEGVEVDCPILRDITLVDTPGILSGQKQRSRNYDYEGVMKWFAERADLIIVMFDAHKLDISDELQRVIELLIPHMDKMRVVLNKADSISTQQLMRVYGALMWSLGKVMDTPEVCRVYIGSFWDNPLHNSEQAPLLQKEERDLLTDIVQLPQQAIMRKINDLVRRARSVKVHAYIIHYLRKQLPYTFGKKEKQRRLVGRLDTEMLAAARRYGLPKGDFPALEPFRQGLFEIKDLSEFPKLDKKMVKEMDKVFSIEIPELLEHARSH